jgi:hypothetical protein
VYKSFLQGSKKHKRNWKDKLENMIYNIAPLVAISSLESPSLSECEKGKRFEARISVALWCVYKIQASIRPTLERL